DGKDYKAESVHNCYASIAQHLKDYSEIEPCKLLGKTEQEDFLTTDEITKFFDHKSIQ
ncbi:9423_t:CDS:2, partial [Cetraspora pellucida]